MRKAVLPIFIGLLSLASAAFGADGVPEPREGFTLAPVTIGPNGIPAFVVAQESGDGAARPAVILIHGGSVVDADRTPGLPYKEEWFRPVYDDVPYGLAEAGFLVVVIDAAWAESRISSTARDEIQETIIGAVFSYYVKSVKDVSDTIDYLEGRSDVDASRIGAAGKSGGAITCLLAACQEPRLKAVVSWKGGADFELMARIRKQQVLYANGREGNPEVFEIIESADPIRNVEKVPPIAVALLNNRDDPAIPRETAEALHGALLPLYAAMPDRLMFKLYDTPKPTHNDQVEAFDDGRRWLERHLLTADGAE